MKDHKLAAAGDEYEISSRNENNRTRTVTQEYLASLLVWLETFTGKRLTETELKLWTERLRTYPMWKLDRTPEYNGGLNNAFFQFLDRMEPPIETHKALPEPEQPDRIKSGTRRVLKYCQDVAAADTHEDRVRLEQEFAKDMKDNFNFTYKPILVEGK